MRRLALTLAACFAPALAHADVKSILADATKLCADQNNGTFAANGAVKQIDLTGDGTADTLVDEALFTCTTAASLYGGSGGSLIHIFANGTQSDHLVQGWDTAKWNNSLLILLAVDGTNCNTIAAQTCYETLTWGKDSFLSVRPAQ